MSHAAQSGGHPGRPRRPEIDALRTKTWFWAVAHRLGAHSGYAMEKLFSPEKLQQSNGVTKRPCKFDKYRRGEHAPRPALITEVDEQIPGTAAYADHCFWRVAQWPPIEIDELHEHLASLRPEIADVLFHRARNGGPSLERKPRAYPATFRELRRHGDWDALTACIGVIQEAKPYREEAAYAFYTKATFAVIRRFVAKPPFLDVAEELFEYLMRRFLDNPDGQVLCQQVSRFGIRTFASLTTHRILLIDDLCLLRQSGIPPVSCLHVAEPYLPADVLHHIEKLYGAGEWRAVRQLPEIRKLAKALKRWEAKQPIGAESAAWTGH